MQFVALLMGLFYVLGVVAVIIHFVSKRLVKWRSNAVKRKRRRKMKS